MRRLIPDKPMQHSDNTPRHAQDTHGDGDGGYRLRQVVSVCLDAGVLDRLPRSVLEPRSHVARVAWPDLDAMTLSGPDAPDLILSPLLTTQFDAMDMARELTRKGFRGRYLALVGQLPSAGLIRREVAGQSPGLNFDIIVLDGTSTLHAL
jgi:hypothetical protein